MTAKLKTRPPAELLRKATLLKQASDATRLMVLATLSGGERNVTELLADLGLASQPALSHHLALLKTGGLIVPRRQGKHIFYGLTERGRALAATVDALPAA